MSTSLRRAWPLLVVLCFVTGCYERTTQSDGTAVHSAKLGAIFGAVVCGVLAAPIGYALRGVSRRFLWVGLLATPLLILFLVPSLVLDHATVDAEHFEGRYGFWFAPTRYNVRYADLDHIDLVSWEERKRRGGTRTKQRLDCVSKSGATTTVQVGDLVRHARDEILDNAVARGVKVYERTQ
jgi:hypothetical protein